MKLVDLLMILMIVFDLGPLGLYEDIDDARPRARDSCTSYATENTDYLTLAQRSILSQSLAIGGTFLPLRDGFL
jgi:hypothetical protein